MLWKKSWKQSWPGPDKGFLTVQAKFSWPQQKSGCTSFESPKPRKCFIPGVGFHHQHLPLLCAYLWAADASYSAAGWRESVSGDQASFKHSSLLLCYPARQESQLPPWSFFRDRELLANGCFKLEVARHGAAAVAAGPRHLSPLQPL